MTADDFQKLLRLQLTTRALLHELTGQFSPAEAASLLRAMAEELEQRPEDRTWPAG